jgi:hypothetical protein
MTQLNVLLATERLILRPFTEADLGAMHAIWSDRPHPPADRHGSGRDQALPGS